MCIRDRLMTVTIHYVMDKNFREDMTVQISAITVSYIYLRAHETRHDIVCRLLLEKKCDHRDLHRVDRRQRQMCIRDRLMTVTIHYVIDKNFREDMTVQISAITVSYTHLRAHETRHDLVCRLLLEKK